MLESKYQAKLINKLKNLYPDSLILKNDSSYQQGVPDLTIFKDNKWAMLEVKPSEESVHQPNQEFYVDKVNGMSYGAFIYPENEEDVLSDLQELFSPQG